jgi:actin-related protein 6
VGKDGRVDGRKRGAEVLEEEQVLIMGNERFAGPELLFNPSDIGAHQISFGVLPRC